MKPCGKELAIETWKLFERAGLRKTSCHFHGSDSWLEQNCINLLGELSKTCLIDVDAPEAFV